MIISDEIHSLEWLIAQLLTRVASEISASTLERLVQRWFRVFCIVDTTKQIIYRNCIVSTTKKIVYRNCVVDTMK